MIKKIGLALGFLFASLLFPSDLFAQEVKINEIYPSTNENESEWIEFYNPSNIDLTNWKIEERTSKGTINSYSIGPNLVQDTTYNIYDVYIFEVNKLNDTGDTVTIKNESGEIKDEWTFGATDKGTTRALIPDGSNNRSYPAIPTQGEPNILPSPSPCPSLSPSPLAGSSNAKYHINEPKDSDNNSLSSVEIYVDDKYIHHEDEETITFCEGCYCDPDSQVTCFLGEHKISLQKSGYYTWSETRTISAGQTLEVYPVLTKITSPSPLPSPSAAGSKSPSPFAKPSLSPSPKNSPSPESSIQESVFSGEVLGGENQTPESTAASSAKKSYTLPAIISVTGAGFLSLAGGTQLAQYIKKRKLNKL